MLLRISLARGITPPKKILPIILGTLKTLAKAEKLPPSLEVSLLLCGNSDIESLNRRYRNTPSPTDVLSFPQHTGREGLPLTAGEPLLLGDIAISLEKAREQALEYGHSLERELGFLFLHGLLHLLGYNHRHPRETFRMRARERAILRILGLRRDGHGGQKF